MSEPSHVVFLSYASQDAEPAQRICDALRAAGIEVFQIAQVYALRNDAKETFAWLDRAWTARDPGITSLLFDPFILRYKGDPRFAAFCKKVGLPARGEASARTPI